MAVGLAIQSEGGQYAGKITGFVVLSCMIAATGGIIFGYDLGISGGLTSMESFLKKFFPEVYKKMKEETKTSNYCKFDSQLLTLFTSSLHMAGLIASFFASPVTRAYGRKPSILIGGAALVAGAALGGASYNIYMLLLGRVLLGIGLGFTNQAVPLYLSEMALSKYRGAFNMGFQICLNIGFIMATFTNYCTVKIKGGWGWRISLAMAAAPAAILTTGAIFLPETPNSLIEHGDDHVKAKKMLQRIRGVDDVQVELNDLIHASYASKSVKHPFKNLLQRKYRPQLVMSIAIPFFIQATGISVIGFYAPILFRTIGLAESVSLLSATLLSFVGLGSTIASSLMVDKIGRRDLFHLGGILMFVTQILIGAIMAAKLGDHGELSKRFGVLVLILICVYVAAFGLSWGPLGWVVTSEIFPLEIRSAAQSINVATSLLFTFVVAQGFLAMLCKMKSGIFFFFGGWVALMTGFIYIFLPETKNIPIEKMEKIWVEHTYWKRFVPNGQQFENSKIELA
ncbi:hexose carrier protein HEX6-like [Olea europaea var. sylvestris]|uniref:hexose carrier protein HEX6-like n=1 Tax=Olea europaea var. sylvestris TaxID=158386 RepID=UPI000C1D2BEC|nr:hexose carrier protein HEX6-like [Olea europaea var. sylvestris]